MWDALPPVVSVVTAADELHGISLAGRATGMICEGNGSNCHAGPAAAASTASGSRPSTAQASSAMTPRSATHVSGEWSLSLGGPPRGLTARAGQLLPVTASAGAAVSTSASAPTSAGGSWREHRTTASNTAASDTAAPSTLLQPQPQPPTLPSSHDDEARWARPAASPSHRATHAPPPSAAAATGAAQEFAAPPSPAAASAHTSESGHEALRRHSRSPGMSLLWSSAPAGDTVADTVADAPRSPSVSSTGTSGFHAVHLPFSPSERPVSAWSPSASGRSAAPPWAMVNPFADVHQRRPGSPATAVSAQAQSLRRPASALWQLHPPPPPPNVGTSSSSSSAAAAAAMASVRPPSSLLEGRWAAGDAAAPSTHHRPSPPGASPAHPQAHVHSHHLAATATELRCSDHANASISSVSPPVLHRSASSRSPPPPLFTAPPTQRAHPFGVMNRSRSGGNASPAPPPDALVGAMAPVDHNQSFYMGTTGNDNLRRSFFFPVAPHDGIAGGQDADADTAAAADPYCSPTAYQTPPTFSGSGGSGSAQQLRPVPVPPSAAAQRTTTATTASAPPPLTLVPHSSSSAWPSTGQPLPADTSAASQCVSLSLSTAPLHVSLGELRSPPSGVLAGDASCRTGVSNSSFISPTLANSHWRHRFDDSVLDGERPSLALLPDSTAQRAARGAAAATPGSGAARTAAAASAHRTASTPAAAAAAAARETPAPAYLVDWEQSLAAFQSRAESYYVFKNSCTETYLTLIEHDVDRFLVCYFSGGALRPEESVQTALAGRAGAIAARAPLVPGNGGGGVVGNVAGGGLQKMLQGSKALQKLSETGSKWLTRVGSNLRRASATPAPRYSEPQSPLASSAATVAALAAAPDTWSTPTTIRPAGGAVATAASTLPSHADVYAANPLGVQAAMLSGATFSTSAAGQLTSSASRDSVSSSAGTGQLSPTFPAAPSAGCSSAASTVASSPYPAPVSAEEAELRCIRQLGPFVANVVPETYMDVRPSGDVMAQVQRNHAILLHALQHVLVTDGDSRGASPATDDSPLPPAALTNMPSPVSSSAHANSSTVAPLSSLAGLVSQRLRDGLLLPTIHATWRDYLTPLECKVGELAHIADANIDPILRRLRELSGGDDDEAVLTSPSPTTSAGERAACAALRASREAAVSRLSRLLRGDAEYLSAIHTMDDEFVENGAAWRERGSRMRQRGAALSDYVPVYGLVLSRLHRLEMEHRTVLELWGGSSAVRVQRA
ncbi:hypothetical protein NESM_000344700 [Novymonas esmeraldas]|uniref:Uncharacterized protein n=1 Tax=Novymonas esmeraldas TaxID=1808958 RepID=A0AAW0EJN1_9TRYP